MKNDFDDLNCELRPGIEKKEKKLNTESNSNNFFIRAH